MTYRQNGGADHNVSVRDLAFWEPDRRMTKSVSPLVAANNCAMAQLCIDGAVRTPLIAAQATHSVRVFEALNTCA